MLQVAVYRAADIREHQHRAADALEEIEVWTQAGELRTRISGEQLRRVPPRYARQPESAQYRRKLARVPRKLVPELHALEADLEPGRGRSPASSLRPAPAYRRWTR